MKIDEPKTPYEAYESDGEEQSDLDAYLLTARINAEGHTGPRKRRSKIIQNSVNFFLLCDVKHDSWHGLMSSFPTCVEIELWC